jgi:hypothetical protein
MNVWQTTRFGFGVTSLRDMSLHRSAPQDRHFSP